MAGPAAGRGALMRAIKPTKATSKRRPPPSLRAMWDRSIANARTLSIEALERTYDTTEKEYIGKVLSDERWVRLWVDGCNVITGTPDMVWAGGLGLIVTDNVEFGERMLAEKLPGTRFSRDALAKHCCGTGPEPKMDDPAGDTIALFVPLKFFAESGIAFNVDTRVTVMLGGDQSRSIVVPIPRQSALVAAPAVH